MSAVRSLLVLGALGALAAIAPPAAAQRVGRICPDPAHRCTGPFRPFDLTFALPADDVARASAPSLPFWAVILRSAPRCAVSAELAYRTQRAFPRRQVFGDRFGCEDEALISYVGVDTAHAFLAVYGGTTRREATTLRDSLRAARAYPGATVRRLQAVLHYP
jgi:hypothetical protein